MKIISVFTKFLLYLPGELSHDIAFKGLKLFYSLGLLKLFFRKSNSENAISADIKGTEFSLKLNNRLGIAAGLDKDGEYIDCLAAMGIGFVEVGTVTPRPQKGNKKPRLFRNRIEKSLLNRMGFNNKGVDYLVSKLKQVKSDIIIGVSIGKNFDTPNEVAFKDYEECMQKVYLYADYIAINISSPNTQGLRDLSNNEYLNLLLERLKSIQFSLSKKYGYKPLFLKISPDEEDKNMKNICKLILKNKIDGMICTNTSANHRDHRGPGGISGKPLSKISTQTLKFVKQAVGDELILIASGGVMSSSDYEEKINSGASLVQLYTGLIYEGPNLIKEILNHEVN